MLQVQRFLRDGGTLDELTAKYGIRVAKHSTDPLVILNYHQIDSTKHNPLCMECRGLCLEMGTWNVVARAFPRFFNAGECPELEKKFDWGGFAAESKEDGSLALLYNYRGTWRVNTRGSFADGEIAAGVGKTWKEIFFSALDESQIDPPDGGLSDKWTHVFELCSPYNKNVRRYERPVLYLLTSFHNESGRESHEISLDNTAHYLRVKRPGRFQFSSLKEIQKFLEEVEDPTFEGVVLRDRTGLRIKVKSARYVALHHLGDNGNVFNPRRLIPLILAGEHSEVLTYYPEVSSVYFDLVEKLGAAESRMMAVWEQARGLHKQKDFALYVTKHTSLHSVLFTARKEGCCPKEVFRKSEDLLIKKFAGV